MAGPRAVLGWPTLALIGIAPVGFVLSQHAYRAGSLGVALSTTTVVDPLVAVTLAVSLLGEPVHAAPPGATVAIAAAVLVVAGVLTLAHTQTPGPLPAAGQPPGGRSRRWYVDSKGTL